MNTILVPIDFSPASRNAFFYALRIANLFHAKVMVFHAYNVSIPEPYLVPASQDLFIQEEEKRIQELFEEMEREVPPEIAQNIELEFKISLGPATDEIMYLCESVKPGLVVMGMKSSNDLARAILGSVCTHLIQRLGFPILVVPEKARYQGIRNIAYASNFEEDDVKTIEELMEFAFLYDALIHTVHIKTKSDENNMQEKEDAIITRFKDDIIMHRLDFEDQDDIDTVAGINHYLESHDIDMLAMLTHKRGFWGRLVHSSKCKEMALKTDVPLLVFRMSN